MWLGCGEDSQEQRGAELLLQMHNVVDCAGSLGPCAGGVKCDITVSVALWQSICIISLHTNILSNLGSIHLGFTCESIF